MDNASAFRRLFSIGVTAWFSLWSFATARADDGAVSGIGGTVKMLKGPPTIRMVSEAVSIKVPEGNVRASFVFLNEGPATTVTMGFPESGEGPDGSTRGKTAFSYFRSFVDGKPVKCRLWPKSEDEDAQTYDYWWVKNVHFAAHQRRVVVDEYGGSGGGATDGSQWIPYNLLTGATWKGTIGYARIVADVKALGDDTYYTAPENCKRVGTNLIWEFRNLKPSEEDDTDGICVTWFPGFKAVSLNGKDLSDNINPPFMDEYAGYWPHLEKSELVAPMEALATWIGASIKGDGDSRTLSWKSPSGVVLSVTAKGGSKKLQAPANDRVMLHPAFLVRGEGGKERCLVVRVGPIIRALGGRASYYRATRTYSIWLLGATPAWKSPRGHRRGLAGPSAPVSPGGQTRGR